MKAKKLFLSLVITAVTILLFASNQPELYAVGTLTTVLTIIAWGNFIQSASKW